MFGFVRGVRGRAVVVVLVVAGLLGGVTASSVAAATKTTVTWKVSSLTAGQEKNLSAVASTNSKGVKTWSKTGSCTLSPKSKPTKLTMGTGVSCTLTLEIAKSGKYPAKTSTKKITRKSTLAPTTTTTTIALTCAMGGSCAVGDPGPGGGIVFYVDLTREPGAQYFEAAPVGDEVQGSWATGGNQSAPVTGADSTAIGTGEQNTADIVAQSGNLAATSAAVYCSELVSGGQSDWFLPSKDELNLMYTNLQSASTPLGGFSSDFYWSSSEDNFYLVWGQNFNVGGQDLYGKINSLYVRPVRAF